MPPPCNGKAPAYRQDLSHPPLGESHFWLRFSARNDPGLSAGTTWDRSQDRSHLQRGESSNVLVFFQSNRSGTGTHRLAFIILKGLDRSGRPDTRVMLTAVPRAAEPTLYLGPACKRDVNLIFCSRCGPEAMNWTNL